MIGWTIVIGCMKKSSVKNVTHLSIIMALGNLTLEFPWHLG
jgi:hypothetical protein